MTDPDPIARALTKLGIFQVKEEDLMSWHELARYWSWGG